MRISDWSSDVCSSDLGQSGQADRYLCCTFSAPKRSHKSGRFQRHRPKPPARTRGTFAATSRSLQDYLCPSSETLVAIVELCSTEYTLHSYQVCFASGIVWRLMGMDMIGPKPP